MPARLHLVVEIPYSPEPFWLPLPPTPWPEFVRLSADCGDDEVGLVMFTLATYNRASGSPPMSPSELIQAKRLLLPGGVAVEDEAQEIHPSCCSGVECWSEWQNLLDDGHSPWMGHDPTPTAQRLADGSYRVWPDEALTGRPIAFDEAQLRHEVARLPADLQAFHQRLSAHLAVVAPEVAERLSQAFWRQVVAGAASAA